MPRLSQLRAAKGLAAHDTNIRDTICRLIAEKHLPFGPCCAVSHMPTEDVMWFDVHCESTYSKASNRLEVVLLVLVAFISWPLALLMRTFGVRASSDSERYGREIVIAVPLTVRSESQTMLRRGSQRYLRQILSTVPEYHQLFREHPQARIYPK
ncbi:MAG TPA: hypothetical protein VGI40_12945 [Pirellulaceae bacterium]